MVVFEIGCFKLLNAPGDGRLNGLIRNCRAKGWGSRCVPSVLLVKFVAQPMHLESFLNSCSDLALSEPTMRDWLGEERGQEMLTGDESFVLSLSDAVLLSPLLVLSESIRVSTNC